MREADAVAAAVSAAAALGIRASDAVTLRVGENGVVAFPGAGLLARVVPGSQGIADARHEIAVARWLTTVGMPVVAPAVNEPIAVGANVVTFWEYLRDARAADVVTLARFLRRLHRLPRPPGLLGALDPFDRFTERMASAVFTPADRSLLDGMRADLADGWANASFCLGESVIHGDAHMDNLLMTPSGEIGVIDLQTMSLGPPEWDLTLTALYFECGWYTATQYAEFADAYGYDVRADSAWPVLRGIRMLRMVTWLAQSAADSQGRREQLRHRLRTLRDGTAPAGWSGY